MLRCMLKKNIEAIGYSKLLNDALLNLAKEKGIKKLYLKTTLHNYYEKFGAKFLENHRDESILYFDIGE